MKVVVERTWLEDLDKRSILGGQRTCEALGTGNIKTWRCGQGKSNLTIYAWYGGDYRGESQRFVHPQTQCFTFGCNDIWSPDMNAAISYFGGTELPRWSKAFWQEFTIVLDNARKSY